MNATAISGLVIRETGKAFSLRIEGCESDAWLPKSQFTSWTEGREDYRDGLPAMRTFSAEVPAWLARKLPWNTRTSTVHRPW